MHDAGPLPRASAWWSGTASQLLSERDSVVGTLAQQSARRDLATSRQQEAAWQTTVEILTGVFERVMEERPAAARWGVLLEYEIPRRALRPDVILLAGSTVVVIEMKVGASAFERRDRFQVEEYALDLRDFHEESHGLRIIPLLVATSLNVHAEVSQQPGGAICTSPGHLARFLLKVAEDGSGTQIDLERWERSRYRPTPTIVEAARAVYAGHDVRAIGHSYADNLGSTVGCVQQIIQRSQALGRRSICFVTGVPGSGKTLAGLTAVHAAGPGSTPLGAYLSGNGPLVDVLGYAIATDLKRRTGTTMKAATRQASVFIQPVHRFIGELHASPAPPPEHVIVFDEAQRAWDEHQMKKKNLIEASEAEVALRIMSRPPGWSTIVALVGSGQEISAGEAGIEAWVGALRRYPDWEVHAPREVARLFPPGHSVTVSDDLHLTVSVRAPRAKALSEWVDAVLDDRPDDARKLIGSIDGFPIMLTRHLEAMRRWLRDRRRIDRRTGLVASAQARRLRPFGIEMSDMFQRGIDWPRWFVDDPNDIRASDALEVAASEFKCQGLELDWVGVCWGSDVVRAETGKWSFRKLSGGGWVRDSKTSFALNRYRVLLTRARLGMVIWVPQPATDLPLVEPAELDRTAAYLESCGVKRLA